MHKTSFTFRLISVLGLLGCAVMPAAAQSTGDILFYKKAAGAGYDAIYLAPVNNRVLGFNGSGALTLSVPFSGAFSDLTGRPTTLGGYGITDSVALTTSTYVNPGFISSLAWSKITSIPSSLSGYGITDGVVNTRTVNGHALSADVTVTKSDVGLGNVANADTTNATNILSGTLAGVRVQTQMSLTKDGSGLKLNGDALAPGNNMYYGTDASGAKGFYSVTLPGGGSGDVQYNDGGTLQGLTGLSTSGGVLQSISLSPANDSTGLTLNGGAITGSGATPFASITGTWSTTGTPTAIKANITDTASNAASLLMDLQLGGNSRFRVTKDGYANAQRLFAGNMQIADGNISVPFAGLAISAHDDIVFSLNDDKPFSITGGSITGSGTTSFASFSGTWNTSGSPAAMKWVITDTASNDSAGNTRLMDWLVDSGSGAVSQFYVSKVNASNEQVAYFKGRDLSLKVDGGSNGLKFGSNSLDPIGTINLGSNSPFASLNCSGTVTATTFTAAGGDFVDIINTVASGATGMRLLTAGGYLLCTDGVSNHLWSATSSYFSVRALAFGDVFTTHPDTYIVRISTDIVGMQNGTSPQEFRVYGTTVGDKFASLKHNGTDMSITESGSGVVWRTGAGDPEGNVTAPVGSLYTRTDGGTSTTLYIKESGSGNTGWIAK